MIRGRVSMLIARRGCCWPSLIIDWSPVQVWEGPPNSDKAYEEIHAPLSFLVLSISGLRLLPVSSGPLGQPKDST